MATSKNLMSVAAAATAAWMYADAKYLLSYDLGMIKGAVLGQRRLGQIDASGKLNFFYTLEERALDPKVGGRTFLVYEGRRWTYRQFYDGVLRYGQWLKKHYRVAPDEIVALDCMNRPGFLFMWFGLWSVGAKVAFLNYNLTGGPLLHSVKTSTARLLLVDEEVRGKLTDAVLAELASPTFRNKGGAVEVAYFSDALEQEVASFAPIREPDSVRAGQLPTSLAVLIYTSGTTGNPKPSVCPWGRMHGVGVFVPSWLGIKPDDVFYTCMPLYHASASMLAAVNSIAVGCTLALGHTFGTRTFWEEVRATDATYIQYVGETCRYLLGAPPSPLDAQNKVRVAFGNGLRPDIWDKFKERFGIETINEFYAATEGPGGAWNRSRNSLTRGAAGRAGRLARWFSGNLNKLVEHDVESEMPTRDPKTGFCKEIDWRRPGAPAGELIAKLPDVKEESIALFAGYYQDKGATEKKILRDVFERGDIYYRTGDMVRISPEGFVFFHDRIGDTFRWKSENVSTNQVADVMAAHPSVAEANVYGVSLPHHDGRAGCAAIVLRGADGAERADSTDVDAATLAALGRHAAANLPRYAVPQFVRFQREAQRTGNNKQQKHHLRAQGVDPAQVDASGDRLFWFRDGVYAEFREPDWQGLQAGQVKL